MNTYFAYGYEVPKKGEQYLIDRINEKGIEKKRMWTSVVKKIKKVEEDIFILYTCNSRYIVKLLR